jgi:23S rRNA (guanosine2251-2'-O)-methyltransferase
VPVEKLNKITRGNHQGVIAFLSAIEYQSIFDIVPTIFEAGRNPFVVILDKITDVRNIGAIARSAECAGVDAIVLPLKGGAQLNDDAVKSSCGALLKLPLCRHSNLVEVINFLKESGIEIVGVYERAEKNYFNKEFTQPLCIILGNEYEGIAWDYLRECNDSIKIPMVGTIDSLNVSVATGIVLFEVVKQRMR